MFRLQSRKQSRPLTLVLTCPEPWLHACSWVRRLLSASWTALQEVSLGIFLSPWRFVQPLGSGKSHHSGDKTNSIVKRLTWNQPGIISGSPQIAIWNLTVGGCTAWDPFTAEASDCCYMGLPSTVWGWMLAGPVRWRMWVTFLYCLYCSDLLMFVYWK